MNSFLSLRQLTLALLIIGAVFAARPAAGCQATLMAQPDSNAPGKITGTAIGRGSCGTGGGAVDLLLSTNGGPFTSIANCLDSECRKELAFFAYCATSTKIDLKVKCSKPSSTGNGCDTNDEGSDSKTISIDHANSLDVKRETHDPQSGGIEGVFHYRTPAAGTSHALHYDWLLSDGSFSRASAQTLGPPEEADQTFIIGPPPGQKSATLIVTLDSCGDVFSPVVFDAGGDRNCNSCDLNQPPECATCVGSPVQLWSGNMQITHTDPLPAFPGVGLTRKYDSDGGVFQSWFGLGWSSIFDRYLTVYPNAPFGPWAVVWINGSKRFVFRRVNGSWVQMWPRAKEPAIFFVSDASGRYVLQEPQRDIEVSIDPQTWAPVSYRSRSTGRELLITYAGGVPIHVSDSWGTFGWTINSSGHHIDSISIDGTSLLWQYVYSGDLLTAVNGPGGATWRTYIYAGGRVTEARDGAGRLLESHAYDQSGRATSSVQAQNDIQAILYDQGSRNAGNEQITRVVSASGATTNYWLSFIGGRTRTVEVEGNCAGCGVNNAVFAYKPGDGTSGGGQLFRMQDARGYITEWTYDLASRVIAVSKAYKPGNCDPETDPARCHLSPGNLATAQLSATSATETTDYFYEDALWPDKPTRITRASISNPGATTSETFVHDASTGVVLSDTQRGWNGTMQETHVATTALYDGSEGAAFAPGGAFSAAWLTLAQPKGLRKSLDGPRTDVADYTKWVYYPINDAIPSFWRGQVAAMRDATGHLTRFENYDAFGNPGRVVDANGVVTETTYDGIGRLLTTTIKGIPGCDTSADPLCATDLTTTRAYEATYGPLLSETRPNGATTTYEYDTRGRLAAMVRPVSASLWERLEYDYDPATGYMSAERYLSGQPGSWTIKRSEAFRYDTFARLIAVDHPDETSILYSYDAVNNVVGAQDEKHATPNTTYRYDPVNRLVQVIQTLAGATGGTIATQYAYDLHSNLVSVTDPNGNVTTYSFDDFDRMKQQVSPVTGTTMYAYDSHGNLTSSTDANVATTTRTYDALNRVLTAVSRKGTQSESVSWSYDDAEAGHFGIGRLAAMTDPTGSTTYVYERRGLLRTESKTIDGDTFVTSYGHDADGNRTSMADSITYTYDLADRPVSAQWLGTPIVTSASYLPFGPLRSIIYGNGTARSISYDTRYRVTENELTGPGGSLIADYAYASDNAGNITQVHDVLAPVYNRDFGYDDLNRLTTANSGASLWGNGSFSYDAMGNVLTSALGGATQSFTYTGTTPKLSSVAYDAAGNELRTPLDSVPLAYSPRNLWTSVGYDGRGLRTLFYGSTSHRSGFPVTRTRTRTLYTPELKLLLAETTEEDSSGIVAVWTNQRLRQIIWFADIPVGQVDSGPFTSELLTDPPTPTVRFTFTDHLGTPLLQTDEAAAVVWRAEYTPHGSIYATRVGNADRQPLRLPGQDALAGEGTYYNVFRWYRSTWGRYTQTDPLGLAGGLDLYAYVEDNPVRFYDPLGLISPLPPKDQKTRACNSKEEAECRASCKYGMQSCRVNRTFRVTRAREGKVVKGWVDGPVSCSCKEPDCLDKLKEMMKKVFDPSPRPGLPVIPVIPPPPPTMVPDPVIPGFLPVINPFLIDPRYCGVQPGGIA